MLSKKSRPNSEFVITGKIGTNQVRSISSKLARHYNEPGRFPCANSCVLHFLLFRYFFLLPSPGKRQINRRKLPSRLWLAGGLSVPIFSAAISISECCWSRTEKS